MSRPQRIDFFHEQCAHFCRVLDQIFLVDDFQRSQATSHRQIVAPERRRMHDTTIHSAERLLVNGTPRDDREWLCWTKCGRVPVFSSNSRSLKLSKKNPRASPNTFGSSSNIPGSTVSMKFIAPLKGSRTKHYQFTAIDDCTRIRVLRIYDRLNQETAIRFADYVVEKLPFAVEVIQTDNGSEFQSRFP